MQVELMGSLRNQAAVVFTAVVLLPVALLLAALGGRPGRGDRPRIERDRPPPGPPVAAATSARPRRTRRRPPGRLRRGSGPAVRARLRHDARRRGPRRPG
jgi:hypothetical protein